MIEPPYRVVVLGAGGQIGAAVVAALTGPRWDVAGFDHVGVDICDHVAVDRAIAGAAAVVNAAAFTDVEAAETDRDTCMAVNAVAPAAIAQACDSAQALLLHFSSDYVFDGRAGPAWREDDPPNPLSHYGYSKVLGERAVREGCARHLTLRTSWVFSSGGRSFVTTMLGLARDRREISVVDDQIGGPTPAAAIGAACALMLRVSLRQGFSNWGTYHFSGLPTVSWHDLAQATLAGQPAVAVRRIGSADYPTKTRRPLNSVLDCSRIHSTFGVEQPDWRPALNRILRQAR